MANASGAIVKPIKAKLEEHQRHHQLLKKTLNDSVPALDVA